jgi:hypothetical protein
MDSYPLALPYLTIFLATGWFLYWLRFRPRRCTNRMCLCDNPRRARYCRVCGCDLQTGESPTDLAKLGPIRATPLPIRSESSLPTYLRPAALKPQFADPRREPRAAPPPRSFKPIITPAPPPVFQGGRLPRRGEVVTINGLPHVRGHDGKFYDVSEIGPGPGRDG